MTVKDSSGEEVTIQMGPIIRGTALRDVYKGASYQDFNDQVLFVEYGRAINQQASNMIRRAIVIAGDFLKIDGAGTRVNGEDGIDAAADGVDHKHSWIGCVKADPFRGSAEHAAMAWFARLRGAAAVIEDL